MGLLFFIDKSLRIVAAIQLVYFIFLNVSQSRRSASTIYVELFALGVIGYLLSPFSIIYHEKLGYLMVPFLIGAWACGFLMWMMAQQFFDDDFKFRRWHLFLFVVVELASFSIGFKYPGELYSALFSWFPKASWIVPVFLPQLFTLIFAVLAIRISLAGREADLVEKRRVFRGQFVIVCCAVVLIVVGTEMLTKSFHLSEYPDIITSTVVMTLTFWMSHLTSSRKSFELPEYKKVTDKNELEKKNEAEFALKLNNFIENQKFFLDSDMSVAKFASLVGSPEYKIRNYINQTLGFKNFNDFLNQHRVKEACLILRDPNKADISIYNLCLDLGFGSPVSFNRAFKKFTGMTPTEYRQQKNSLS